MEISTLYDINQICIEIEKALMIDGTDYAERDISTIITNVKNRIIRKYQLDLTDIKIYDEALYIGKQRASAVMFVENVSILHARLCGYLQIVRYTGEVQVKPINVNYLGFQDYSLNSLMQLCMRQKTLSKIGNGLSALETKVCTISNCIEKKLFLILIIAYELGLYELMAAVAEIIYLGDKI